jgi:hypothetical protein
MKPQKGTNLMALLTPRWTFSNAARNRNKEPCFKCSKKIETKNHVSNAARR